MQMRKCSNNGGFADVKLSLFYGSQLCGLELFLFSVYFTLVCKKEYNGL